MKQIGIIGLIVILILFGTPLIDIKDNHKNMKYEEIGDVMLNNVETYVNFLDTTSDVANSTINIIKGTLDKISNFMSSIADFVKGILEKTTGKTCTGTYEDGWYCISSDGGGGGSFGGR